MRYTEVARPLVTRKDALNESTGEKAVLVVDDDRDHCLLVRQLLRPLGYEIRIALTAGEALAAVRRDPPALVLLDVHLPGISGYEVCRQIRDEFGDRIAIIFLSGKRKEDFDRTAGLLLGADDYIVKPFVAGELIARVRRAVDRAAAPPAGAASDLTRRELDVLRLLADGLGQEQIARALFITSKTVATHIQHILGKLGLHSRAEAVAFAHRHNLFRST
jgi:DNA-binding NarL/FixJ family response regulator